MKKNLGFKVWIRFKDRDVILRNVTEIHYKYPSPLGEKIAFESDIHGTGLTYEVKYILEFEATIENKKAKEF